MRFIGSYIHTFLVFVLRLIVCDGEVRRHTRSVSLAEETEGAPKTTRLTTPLHVAKQQVDNVFSVPDQYLPGQVPTVDILSVCNELEGVLGQKKNFKWKYPEPGWINSLMNTQTDRKKVLNKLDSAMMALSKSTGRSRIRFDVQGLANDATFNFFPLSELVEHIGKKLGCPFTKIVTGTDTVLDPVSPSAEQPPSVFDESVHRPPSEQPPREAIPGPPSYPPPHLSKLPSPPSFSEPIPGPPKEIPPVHHFIAPPSNLLSAVDRLFPKNARSIPTSKQIEVVKQACEEMMKDVNEESMHVAKTFQLYQYLKILTNALENLPGTTYESLAEFKTEFRREVKEIDKLREHAEAKHTEWQERRSKLIKDVVGRIKQNLDVYSLPPPLEPPPLLPKDAPPAFKGAPQEAGSPDPPQS